MLLNTPSHILNTPSTTLTCTPIPQNALKLSRKVEECKALPVRSDSVSTTRVNMALVKLALTRVARSFSQCLPIVLFTA
jgi:hypothetical protein